MAKFVKLGLQGLSVLFAIVTVVVLWGAFATDGPAGADAAASAVPTGLMALAAAWAAGRVSAGEAGQQQSVALINEVAAFFDEVNAAREFPLVSASRVLSPQGQPLLLASPARLYEVKTVSVSNKLGTRVNLGGMPVYVGRSVPRTKTELRASASGEIAVTAQTLLFSGDARSIDIELARLTSIEISLGSITVTARGRAKPLTFEVANGVLWGQLLRNLMQVPVSGRALPTGAALAGR